MRNTASGAWEVRAGLIPGTPRPEFTKRWVYTSAACEEDSSRGGDLAYHATFAKLRAEAMDYFAQMSMPQLNNWAELTFIWF
jgi:hypothetical protein